MQLAAHHVLTSLILVAITGADLPNYERSVAYDRGELGSYPNQTFRSSKVVAPRFNVLKRHPNPSNDIYTLLSLRGHKVKKKGPMIIDSHNHLVWFLEHVDNTYDLRVQQYQGQSVLTYWSGYDGYIGHGRGSYHVLDSSYREILKVSANYGFRRDWGDQHEFIITKEGTAVLMIYERRRVDLSSADSSKGNGWIWDCLVQEIVINSKTVVFLWRASDWVPLNQSIRAIGRQGSHYQPWDWFHLNSIAKDERGNYLLSSRYTSSIFYVDGKNGSIIWTLGGKGNVFQDLSEGKATNFRFQHDARWQVANALSLFDNSAEGDTRNGTSRGMLLQLQVASRPMTARLIHEYVHPDRISSISQGNMQVLESSGDVLVGWGYAGTWTEFAPNGTVVEDVRFQPSTEFQTGNVESYRAIKSHWHGFPKSQPSLVIEGSSAYVSWNGATEVSHWMLQSISNPWFAKGTDWTDVGSETRQGFETILDFEEDHLRRYLRVVAFSADDKVLGKTKVVNWRFARRPLARAWNLNRLSSLLYPMVLFVIVALILLRFMRRYVRRFYVWRHRGRRGTLHMQRPLGSRPV